MEKTGPTLVIIPEQRVYNCFGCKYHDFKMIRSGLNPMYDTNCLKMDLYGNILPDGEKTIIPYILDNDSKTPEQCPFLKSEKRSDKINNLGL
jgi:hypothetical protein